jgi:hypothetical protein
MSAREDAAVDGPAMDRSPIVAIVQRHERIVGTERAPPARRYGA